MTTSADVCAPMPLRWQLPMGLAPPAGPVRPTPGLPGDRGALLQADSRPQGLHSEDYRMLRHVSFSRWLAAPAAKPVPSPTSGRLAMSLSRGSFLISGRGPATI